MADIEKQTRDEVKALREQLTEMSFSMRIFSLTMRSLYVENAVGTDDKLAVRFRKLRDDTRDDAMVYLKVILPLSIKFVSSISEYFEYYEALNYDEWCEMLSDILQETTGYRQLCEILVNIHEDIMVTLKKRKDEATILLTEFNDLKKRYEEQVKVFEDRADTKRKWALGLCWIPYVNAIATPLLLDAANSDLAQAIADSKQAELFGSASIVVSTTLIPALEHFIDGIKKAAAFFSVMENELKKFEGNAEKGQSNPKKLYYKVMNTEAKDMKSICQIFYAVLPDVRTDFRAIPDQGTDQNYVDRWLEKEKKMIQEDIKNAPKLIEMLLKSITEGN